MPWKKPKKTDARKPRAAQKVTVVTPVKVLKGPKQKKAQILSYDPNVIDALLAVLSIIRIATGGGP